jgi:hypothetical protein
MIMDDNETPRDVHGRLKESAHYAGYAIGRASDELEWLLQGDRWKECGFGDIEEFISSITMDGIPIDQRSRISKRLEELRVSQRAAAKALGVSEQTIARDLGKARGHAPKGAQAEKKTSKNKALQGVGAPKGAAISLGGTEAAELVEKERARKEKADGRIDRVKADEERIMRLVPIAGKHRTIILDPAWDYEWLSLAGRAKPGYAMQSHEELLALDVRAWADEETGCHLYLWVTNNFMASGCELMARWGFQHRTVITWVKEGAFGLGSYFRNSTEHVLFGTLGETTTRHNWQSFPKASISTPQHRQICLPKSKQRRC